MPETTRRSLVVETWVVMIAFLAPAVISAVVTFAQSAHGSTESTRFPVLVHNPVENLVLGILSYLPVAAVVPVGLVLLARTGQPPAAIGLGRGWLRDLPWGMLLVVLAFIGTLATSAVLAPLLENSSLVHNVGSGPVPHYYEIWGLAISITTAVAEETLVNAYLLTRLEQLGWSPGRAFALSIVLRTSYHVYYGLGFLLTVPFGVVVTLYYQRTRRLNSAITAHFLYDAILTTISIF